MVLQGLAVPIWTGWLSGMLYFKVPWGIPQHKTWFEPIFIFHGVLTIFSIFLWLDYICSYSETFGGDIPIRQIITKAFTYLAILCSAYLRICFGTQVKKSVLFFQRLEQHPIFSYHGKTHLDFQVISRTDKCILMFALILKSTAAAAFAGAVATQRKRQNSWFSMLSTFEYSTIFFIFAILPIAISIHLAFSFSVVITKYLIFIYEEFCNCFEKAITFGLGDNVLGLGFVTDTLVPFPPTSNAIFQNKGELMTIGYKKQMRESLLKQFDLVTELYHIYDEVTGPYLLGLVIVTITFFVQTINAILIFDLSPLFLAFDWFTLICLVAQLVLILFNLGHYAHRTIACRKVRLRRLIAGMPNTFDKEQLIEIMDLVSTWDWKMSAWGFFVIDRTLMPGVLSIMMSYIVILFQLQLNTNKPLSPTI